MFVLSSPVTHSPTVQICSCLLNHFHKTLREFFLNLLPAKSKVENKTNIAKLKGMFNRMETVVIGNKCQKIFLYLSV